MSGIRRHPIRTLARLLGLAFTFLVVALDYWLLVARRGGKISSEQRMRWLKRSSRRLLRASRVQASYYGEPPQKGLLVSNHLSYLDILVFGQHQHLVFVSKADVRSWPLIGWLTHSAGTLFLKREDKMDVLKIAAQFAPLIEKGAVIALFPEGTSSDGSQVLPFRSSLLEPAAQGGWPVSPAAIEYSMAEGDAGKEICYWGDMVFGPHLLNLLSKKTALKVKVTYGPAIPAGMNRKEMARELHRRVSELKATSTAMSLSAR